MSDFFGNATGFFNPAPIDDKSIFWMRPGTGAGLFDVLDRRTGAIVDDELSEAAAKTAVVTRNQGVAP